MKNLSFLTAGFGLLRLALAPALAVAQTTNPSIPSASVATAAQMPANWQQLPQKNLDAAVLAFYKVNGHLVAAQTQRTQVAQALWSQYLIDDQHFGQAVATDQDGLVQAVGMIAGDLPSDSMLSLVPRFTAMANNQAVITPMPFGQLKHLYNTLIALKVPPATGRQMVLAWMGSGNHLPTLTPGDVGRIGIIFQADFSAGSASARQAIANQAWSSFLSNSNYVATGKFGDLTRLLDVIGPQLTASQQQQLTIGVVQRYQNDTANLAAVTLPHLAYTVVAALRNAGATDAQIATVISNWAVARDQRASYADDDGGVDRRDISFRALGVGDSNAQALDQLITTQLQSRGAPLGPTTAALLAFTNAGFGNLAAWNTQLDAELGNSSLSADAKAVLLLSKANAAEQLNGAEGNLDGQAWAEQALANALSPNLRVACVQWLMSRMLGVRNYTQANLYVTTLSQQLSDPLALQQLTQLSIHVSESSARAQFEAQDMASVVAAQQPSARLAGQLSLLQSQLAKAQATNRPTSEIESLQTLITNIQVQLPQAPPTTSPSQ